MYLPLALIVLAILFAVVGIFSGGAFTIVLVPLAVIAFIGGLVTVVTARAAGVDPTRTKQAGRQSGATIRRRAGGPVGDTPAGPEEYVDALRRNQ